MEEILTGFLAEVLQAVVVAIFMATVANRLVEGLIKPFYAQFKWDTFTLLYVSWVVAGLLVWLTGVNLFAPFIPDPLTGKILSAIVAGGGANLLADLFVRPQIIEISGELEEVDFE